VDATVVIATRNRRATVLATLGRVAARPARPPVIVVDDASADGTAEAVRAAHPWVRVLALDRGAGAAARNAGVEAADTELVAFSDDDSWWAPGALERAGERFARHPDLGLLAARILVGPDERLDPTCAAMRRGARHAGEPGPRVLGFVACGAVVRRTAFLGVGGFDRRLGVGGEEALLALDLAAAGWTLVYDDTVVAHHHPDRAPRVGRPRRVARNDLWTAWLRRSPRGAAEATVAALRPSRIAGLADAAAGLPWVLRERRPVPPAVERRLREIARDP
jgi:N-acetylglucosaminyl-diphospho-decaprenol L-rhamnosyltransferase